jgi:GDP-D-mannose dehydratase
MTKQKTALITGITGQDGSYQTDTSNLVRIVQETQPDEIYNLGAQSHVAVSFDSPEYAADVDAMGTLRLLEAIRIPTRAARTPWPRCMPTGSR